MLLLNYQWIAAINLPSIPIRSESNFTVGFSDTDTRLWSFQ